MLEKMRIPPSDIRLVSRSFYETVPRYAHGPVGQIDLTLVFGDEANFRREVCTYEVIDFMMAYNMLIDGPQLGQLIKGDPQLHSPDAEDAGSL